MLVITGVTALFNAVFYSTSAGVGNLIAEGDKERIMRVFKELFSARFFMVASVCFGFYILVNSFISLFKFTRLIGSINKVAPVEL